MACIQGMSQARAFLFNSVLRVRPCSQVGRRYLGAIPCYQQHDREASRPSSQCRTMSTSLKKVDTFLKLTRRRKYVPAIGEDFNEIYKFKYILATRCLCRLKLYQTSFTVFCLPIFGTMCLFDQMSLLDFECVTGLTGFALAMLYIMTGFFQRIACIVYFSREKQELVISHMTFWGKRRETHIQLDDIMPISDTFEAEKLNRIYNLLNTYSGHTFYMFLHHSTSGDITTLKNLLGMGS